MKKQVFEALHQLGPCGVRAIAEVLDGVEHSEVKAIIGELIEAGFVVQQSNKGFLEIICDARGAGVVTHSGAQDSSKGVESESFLDTHVIKLVSEFGGNTLDPIAWLKSRLDEFEVFQHNAARLAEVLPDGGKKYGVFVEAIEAFKKPAKCASLSSMPLQELVDLGHELDERLLAVKSELLTRLGGLVDG